MSWGQREPFIERNVVDAKLIFIYLFISTKWKIPKRSHPLFPGQIQDGRICYLLRGRLACLWIFAMELFVISNQFQFFYLLLMTFPDVFRFFFTFSNSMFCLFNQFFKCFHKHTASKTKVNRCSFSPPLNPLFCIFVLKCF